MIIPDTRKAVTVILSRHRLDGGSDSMEAKPEHEMNAHDESLKSIAEDMMRALENKSAADLMRALKAFHSQIQVADMIQDQEQE